MPRPSNKRDFAGPARKYAGRVEIDSGPVPLGRWQRPYTRAERDRAGGAEGTDLRPERPPRQTARPPKTRTGSAYNRQGKE